MASRAGTALQAGRLLVATPQLADPNFERTVVLVLDHDESGSLGVVLNRPSPVPVGEILPDVGRRSSPSPGVLFHGGPVGHRLRARRRALAGRARPERATRSASAASSTTPASSTSTRRPSSSTPRSAGMRIFAGYAGWGDGQLDAEIDEGSWYVVPLERR